MVFLGVISLLNNSRRSVVGWSGLPVVKRET